MIPILFDANASSFATNGLGRLIDCVSCEVTEQRNGIYECEFVYPVNGRNYEKITLDRIIYVTHDDTRIPQPFVIYKKTVPIDGLVTFNAHHLSYRLANIVLEPYTAENCFDALEAMPNHSINDNPFSFWTDKTTEASFSLKAPARCKEVLGGMEGSVLDTFGGGEYEWDHFAVKLWANRGRTRDVTIRYGKNLTDITDEMDASGKCNAVIPFWRSVDGQEVVILPELAVFAKEASTISDVWTDEYDNHITDENGTDIGFDFIRLEPEPLDLSMDFEEKPTLAQIRSRARSYLNQNKRTRASRNVELDFVQLWQTGEYERFASLENVGLCDTVHVISEDSDIRLKVVGVTYDSLLDRYISMELGDPKTSLADNIAEVASTAVIARVPTREQVNEYIANATNLISGALGGHVVIGKDEVTGKPNEILIMDTETKETATHVLRINQGGIGFSSNGYDGPFDTFWTLNGEFRADCIKTGTLSGDRIRSGRIESNVEDGQTYWDLENGEFSNSGLVEYADSSYMSQMQLMGGILSGQIRRTDETDARTYFIGPGTLGQVRRYVEDEASFGDGDFTTEAYEPSMVMIRSQNCDSVALFNRGDDDFIKGFIGCFNDIYEINGVNCQTYINGRLGVNGSINMTGGLILGINGGSFGVIFGPVIRTGKSSYSYDTSVPRIMPTNPYGNGHSILAFYAPAHFIFRTTERTTSFASNYLVSIGAQEEYGGSLRCEGAVLAREYNRSSDERLKDFEDWDDRYNDLFDRIEPKIFRWKGGPERHIGVSAQQVRQALEDAGIADSGIVGQEETDEGYLNVNYFDILMLSLKKVKDQQKQIDRLEERLAALERRLNADS